MSIKKVHLNKPQLGFSLVEAMVALTLMAIGLLGQMSMQMDSLSGNQSAYMRSQAAFLANDILDRMRANKAGVEQGFYATQSTAISTTSVYVSPGCIDNAIGCTAQNLAREDVFEWTNNVEDYLANGSATVTQAADGMFTITINWGKKINHLSTVDSALYNRLELRARL